jgi:hypothetical protein
MRADIAPGGTFPDYELPDHTNVARRLSELQGDDPLVLTLVRGHYCPKEHQAAARASPPTQRDISARSTGHLRPVDGTSPPGRRDISARSTG